ncbi:MAG: exodeoxyribonuclease III [Thiotrichales bacterium]
MKIATWNVNSLKVRLPQVLNWLETARPDVLALQETKLPDEAFPLAEINAAGYHCVYSGQKTYNGVALLTRSEPSEVLTEIPALGDPQRRILAATVMGVRILNLYVVNGQEVTSDKYQYKLAWMDAVTRYIAQDMQRHPRYVVLGDFNIAPDDRDVYDPVSWAGRVLCSQPERDALQRILDLGLSDTFRLFEQPQAIYSWWDYRAAGFRRNAGLRIDLILADAQLATNCLSSGVDREPRKWERPSDHAPVVAEFRVDVP